MLLQNIRKLTFDSDGGPIVGAVGVDVSNRCNITNSIVNCIRADSGFDLPSLTVTIPLRICAIHS